MSKSFLMIDQFRDEFCSGFVEYFFSDFVFPAPFVTAILSGMVQERYVLKTG